MNVNFSLKDILIFFTKTSFKIAFFVGISIYKFVFLDTPNEVLNNAITIIFILSLIFLLDDVIENIIKKIKRRLGLRRWIKDLKTISDPQILILIAHYFDYENGKVAINPTSYFDMQEGEYQILQSKVIIFQATTMRGSFKFPFTLQEWAYNELDRAINAKEISMTENKKEYIIKWYSKELKYSKKDFDEQQNYYNEYDFM